MSSLNHNLINIKCVISIILFTYLLTNSQRFLIDCLRVDKNDKFSGVASPSLDKSGWRTVEIVDGDQDQNQDDYERSEKSNLTTKAFDKLSGKKLVEWDDDDLNDFIQNIRDQENSDKSLQELDVRKTSKLAKKPNTSISSLPRVSSKFSRLVYHGQVKQNSTTIKLRDGLRIHIDTHRPLAIYRRSKQQQQQSNTSSEQPSSRIDTRWSVESNDLPSTLKNKQPPQLSKSSEQLMKSSSDWKPIVVPIVASRSRRSGKTALNRTNVVDKFSDVKINRQHVANSTIAKGSDFRWKPIVTTERMNSDEKENSTQETDLPRIISKDSQVVYGKMSSENANGSYERQYPTRNVRIDEPFEDDGLIVLRRKSENSLSKQQVANTTETEPSIKKLTLPSITRDDTKWTPVETTTPSITTSSTLDDLATTTTNPTTTTTTATINSTGPINSNGSMESAAHRSASNLNYIYSSQPQDTLSSRSSYASGNGYYSNYLIPTTATQQVVQPVVQTVSEQLPIIDTTSGQTPEMIADRTPEQPASSLTNYDNGAYTLPQTSVSTFQPAQPLPPRQPVLPPSSNYGGYEYGYAVPPRVQTPSRAQQPTQPQVVKQEHHYHYYGQQQREREQQTERQSIASQQQQQPTSQIIREIQPLLFMQQQPSTTTTTTPAPPQIIREIIRETPTPPQFSRIIQIPQISIPAIPAVPEPPQALQFVSDNPAQRIIRQIVSSSLPAVSVRMPQLPPIRLPALQLPVRLASSGVQLSNQAPVTRQTGSFVIPPMPKKTTTYLTETQAMPTHTTIMHTTQFTPATRTTVYTTDHDTSPTRALPAASSSYKA